MDNKNEIQTFSLTPKTFDQAMQYAKLIADSDLAPKDFKGKPANVLIAMQMGAEVGLQPMQAIQNIAVINGRPCLWGDALLAIIKGHPDFVNINELIKDGIASCTITRKGQTPQTRTFSIEDAKKAGLFGKTIWQQYPERMLQMRARSFCVRDVFADAIKGIRVAEEERDNPQHQAMETAYEIVEEEKKNIGTPLSLTSKVDSALLHEHLSNINNAMNLDELKSFYMSSMAELKSDKKAVDKIIEAKNTRKLKLEKIEKEVSQEAKDISEELSEHEEFIKALGDE